LCGFPLMHGAPTCSEFLVAICQWSTQNSSVYSTSLVAIGEGQHCSELRPVGLPQVLQFEPCSLGSRWTEEGFREDRTKTCRTLIGVSDFKIWVWSSYVGNFHSIWNESWSWIVTHSDTGKICKI
jgi:hypothetical protein